MPMQSAEQETAITVRPGAVFPAVHGARSPRIVDALARELAETILRDRPQLAEYPEALAAWVRDLATVLRYEQWHAEVGMLDADGNVRGGMHYWKAVASERRSRRVLGLDPLSEAQLRKLQAETAHVVADLASIRARGAEALARREPAAEIGGASDVD